jgi:hypothetical protein
MIIMVLSFVKISQFSTLVPNHRRPRIFHAAAAKEGDFRKRAEEIWQ